MAKGILCSLPAEAPARLSAAITLPQLILTRSHTRKQKTRLKRVQIVSKSREIWLESRKHKSSVSRDG